MKVLCTAQMGTGTIMGQTMRVIAIAKALQRRGHDIQFIAAGKLVSIIKDFGIHVIEVEDMPEVEVYNDEQRRLNMPKEEMTTKMKEVMNAIAKIEIEIGKREQPNLILSGTLSGSRTAQQLGIPSMMVFLQPHGEKTFQMLADRLQGNGQEESEKIIDGMIDVFKMADIIILEGMPEISGGITFEDFGQKFMGIKEKIRFTGPLLIEYPDQLPEKEDLKQMHMGDRNKLMVYITIGGGSSLIGEQFLKIVLDALRLIPEVTGIIATGMVIQPEVILQYDPPNNAMIKGYVPGTEMIKASDVTVFHGGSSTLMTCIACGTPAVVVPSIGEQEDNGAVLSEYGAGIVLNKATLTADILVKAIQNIINNPSYRRGAEHLKSLGEKYGGSKVAADWAETLMEGSSQ
ncbi:glycosyltransferase [Pelosinus sp. sgz500959]|uniref:glycosyltransferase n=1 Tax=Pelosinus sp. sgz500959 TaxID=3242472 RepID=UPI0036710EE9